MSQNNQNHLPNIQKNFKEKQQLRLKGDSLREMIIKAIKRKDESHFCQKSLNYIKDNQCQMRNCFSCKRVVCSTCMEICHKNCEKPKTEDLFENHVKYFYSFCECQHDQVKGEEEEEEDNMIPKNKEEQARRKFKIINYKFSCLLSEKFNDIFECKQKEFKEYFFSVEKKRDYSKENFHQFRCKDNDDSGYTVCEFCYNNCESKKNGFDSGSFYPYSKQTFIEKKNKEPKCQCEDEGMSAHDDFNLIIRFIKEIFHNADETINSDLTELIKKIEEVLKEFYKDLLDTDEGLKCYKFMLDCIKILLFMYKPDVNLSPENKKLEFDFMLSLVDKIKNIEKNEIYFTYDRLNLILTYLLNFYKKYLFQHVDLMENSRMNLISRKSRIAIHEQNKKYLNELRNEFPDKRNLFNVEEIIHIFEKINDISCFSVNIDNLPNNKNYPFVSYFLNMLIKSYCFEEKEVIRIKDFILKSKQTLNTSTNYNILLKKLIDECYYISQVFIIDDYLNEYSIEDKEFKDKIFFYDENFTDYLRIRFEENDSNSDQKKISEENSNEEELYYFDVFNNNFISKICLESESSKIEEEYNINNKNAVEIKDAIQDKKLTNAFGYFKVFTIPYYRTTEKENEKQTINKIKENEKNLCSFLLRRIKGIFSHKQIDLNNIIKKLNFDESQFLEYALNNLKSKKSKEINELILEEYDYLKINMDIDMGQYKDDLLYIFYTIFVQELYRSSQFKMVLLHWNFLIFLFLGSKKNVEFLLKDMKFFDFLLRININEENIKKSYLIKSLYGSKKSIENNNFIWNYFYYIYKNFVNKIEELKYLKITIWDNYINEVIDFYQIMHSRRKNLMKCLKNSNEKNLINTMNFEFMNNFIKISKNILIKNNQKDFTPFNYIVNKFETIEKLLIISDIVFSEDFQIQDYLLGLNNEIDLNKNDNDIISQNDINLEMNENINHMFFGKYFFSLFFSLSSFFLNIFYF